MPCCMISSLLCLDNSRTNIVPTCVPVARRTWKVKERAKYCFIFTICINMHCDCLRLMSRGLSQATLKPTSGRSHHLLSESLVLSQKSSIKYALIYMWILRKSFCANCVHVILYELFTILHADGHWYTAVFQNHLTHPRNVRTHTYTHMFKFC